MAKKYNKKVKDEWAGLETDFRDAVMQSSPDEIKKRISEAALNLAALEEARKKDQHLESCQKTYQAANEGYVLGRKRNRLKIAFCKRTLESKGIETPTFDLREKE